MISQKFAWILVINSGDIGIFKPIYKWFKMVALTIFMFAYKIYNNNFIRYEHF